MKARRLILFLTALILSVMLAVYLYAHAQTPAVVHASQAKEKTIHNHLSVQGTLEPIQRSSISVAQTSSVSKTFVSSGDIVHAGDPLLSLSPADWLDADVIQTAAAYLGQKSSANMQEGAILYADMDGTVTELAEVGSILYPAQTAAVISDLSAAQIVVEVPEIYADGITVEQAMEATCLTDGERVYTGRIEQVAGSIQEKKSLLSQSSERSVECVLSVDGPVENLRPGMTMEVVIQTDSVAHGVTVPYAAIHQKGETEYVYIASDQGIERRQVETGYQLSSDIQVKNGVRAGEWVITDDVLPDDFSRGLQVIAE